MAEPEFNEDKEEDNIDQLTFLQAAKYAKDKGITFDASNKDLQQRKWYLKYKVLCTGDLANNQADFQLQDAISGDAFDVRRDRLDAEAGKAKEALLSMTGGGLAVNGTEVLDSMIKSLRNNDAPILVLGETGSGKSSFLNLLFGKDFLPTKLTSNTHVISKIKHGPKCNAMLDKRDGSGQETINEENEDVFRNKLAPKLEATKEDGNAVYSLAEIDLPCLVLESGLVIVDSPGVGESDAMRDMVAEYLINACALIFVINSKTAGGMNQTMKDLLDLAYTKALQEDKMFNPATAIFICNKWDTIDLKDSDDVWSYIVKSLEQTWPGVQKNQIFKLSTSEAVYIQKFGGVSPKLKKILQKISQLLQVSRERLIEKSYRKLYNLYFDWLSLISSHLDHCERSEEERQKLYIETKDCIAGAKDKIIEYHKQSEEWLKKQIREKAEDLKKFLTNEKRVNTACQLHKEDIPQSTDWEHVFGKMADLLTRRVLQNIDEWEKVCTPYHKISAELCKRLQETLPKFKEDIAGIDIKLCPSRRGANYLSSSFEDEFPLLPKFITDKLHGSTMEAIGYGIVFVIPIIGSVLVRGPVKLIKSIFNTTLENNMKKEFSDACQNEEKKKQFLEKYAKAKFDKIVKGVNFEGYVKEDFDRLFEYLKRQKQKMEQVIHQKEELLQSLKKEKRSKEEIHEQYAPFRKQCQQNMVSLHLSGAVVYDQQKIADLQQVHQSVWADAKMFLGTSLEPNNTDGQKQINLRKSSACCGMQDAEALKTITGYRFLNHESLVKFYGTTKMLDSLYQVLEPLQHTLRIHMSNQDKATTHREVLQNITLGLGYLHDKGFVHFDLSQDSVFVDKAGHVKLTNIWNDGSLVKVTLHPDPNGCVYPCHYAHLPLRLLKTGSFAYTYRDDMYSLGILMWELYPGLCPVGQQFELAISLRSASENREEGLGSGFGEQFGEVFLQLHKAVKVQISQCRTALSLRAQSPHDWENTFLKCIDGKLTADQMAEEILKWDKTS